MLRLFAAIIIGVLVDAVLHASTTTLSGWIIFLLGVLAAVVAWYTLPFDRHV